MQHSVQLFSCLSINSSTEVISANLGLLEEDAKVRLLPSEAVSEKQENRYIFLWPVRTFVCGLWWVIQHFITSEKNHTPNQIMCILHWNIFIWQVILEYKYQYIYIKNMNILLSKFRFVFEMLIFSLYLRAHAKGCVCNIMVLIQNIHFLLWTHVTINNNFHFAKKSAKVA